MNVALVYDRVNKFGGAERVLLALHEIFPQAPLYTAVYDPKGAPWAKDFKVIPSFLQKFPFAKKHHEAYPWLMPLAFESFTFGTKGFKSSPQRSGASFGGFDVVISITSEAAKGIITKPSTLHICYCLTPTRYLWSGYHHYLSSPQHGFLNPLVNLLIKPTISCLRQWDQIACQRVDQYLAISKNVKQRIKKYYRRDSTVIYPPVDTNFFKPANNQKKGKYFLAVSRLVSYKKVDIVVTAFNKLKWPLIVIGDGIEKSRLKKIALRNIQFLGQNLTDVQLLSYYQNCRALIFAGEEDFGLVSLEAQACGKPVIAFKKGGVPETIVEGKTGEFFYPQKTEALVKTLLKFDEKRYNLIACRNNALKFDKEIFKHQFKKTVIKLWQKHQKSL